MSDPYARSFWPCLLAVLMSTPLAAQRVRIGVSDDYPPYADRDSHGQSSGFDVDVASGICVRLGQNCQLEMMPLAELFRGLSSGRLDLAIGGLAATPARAEIGDLTCPLMHFLSRDEMFYARTGAVDVNSGTIATVRGSLQERALTRCGLRVAVFNTRQEAVRAAMTGQADAFFGSPSARDTVAGAATALTEVGRMDLPPVGAAFLMSHRRPDLLDGWNDQIFQLFESGTIDRLHRRYGSFNGDFDQTRQLSVACLLGDRPFSDPVHPQ